MKQEIIILVAVLLFLGSFAVSPNYITSAKSDNLEYYELPDETVKIFNYSGNDTKVTIPETIKGKKVSSITEKSIGYKTDKNGKKRAIEDFLIKGYYGSVAYKYAKQEGFLFSCLHHFKTTVLIAPTYSQKGKCKYTCKCGHEEIKEVPYKTIPQLKLNSAKPDGEGIALSWIEIKGVKYYNIYRSNGGEFSLINTVDGNNYLDTQVDSGKYTYYIAGTAGENEGEKGVSPTEVNYLKSPDIELTSEKNGVQIKWEAVNNAQKYIIYKKDSNGEFKKISETNKLSFVDTDVQKQSQYHYTVTSIFKDKKESSKSFVGKALIYGRLSKIAYLTFDDGPSNNTKKILKILKKYNAKATFFVTGNDKIEYMKDITDAGHTIALHTYTHDYKKIYSSTSAYFNDLNKIHNLVLKKTGIDARIIRFPGGASNTVSANYSKGIMSKLTKMVENQGYKYFDWNVDSGDASGNNIDPNRIIRNVKVNSKGVDRCVVLMHDTLAKSTTVQALDKICKFYESNGYEFAGLTTTSLTCHQKVNN